MGVMIVVGGPQYRVGSHRQFVLMARQLAAAGYPVLRFDYRGMGDSGGERRTFDAVDDDIRVAIDSFYKAIPDMRGLVILGLCDAASATLMYCCAGDRRIAGLVLVNPWVRTESGEAKAYVQHYYGQRLLQRSFWTKVMTGQFKLLESVRSLVGTLTRTLSGGTSAGSTQVVHFTERMLVGLEAFPGQVLFLLSGQDLTAREFESHCRTTPGWFHQLDRPQAIRLELPEADHTFSSAESLQTASRAIVTWLDDMSRSCFAPADCS